MGYIGVVTHLLTIYCNNFLGHPSGQTGLMISFCGWAMFLKCGLESGEDGERENKSIDPPTILRYDLFVRFQILCSPLFEEDFQFD